jgi:hypothetical protein
MRKRYSLVVAIYYQARKRSVGEDEAIVAAVREAFSKKRRHSDEWCLKKGRNILCEARARARPFR